MIEMYSKYDNIHTKCLNFINNHAIISVYCMLWSTKTTRSICETYCHTQFWPIYTLFLWRYRAFLDVSINETFWTSQSLNILFSSSSRLIPTSEKCWNYKFIEGEGKICHLNSEFLFFEMQNEQPWYEN